jgi:hypothetical protein
MSKARKIKFTCNAARFFDIHGNTYHSVSITKVSTGESIASGPGLKYGYGDHYRQTALELMALAKWLPVKFRSNDARTDNNIHSYEGLNNYPISWHVTDGRKKDAIWNGTL